MTTLGIDNDCDIDDCNSETECKHICELTSLEEEFENVLLWHCIQIEDAFLQSTSYKIYYNCVTVCCSINCN